MTPRSKDASSPAERTESTFTGICKMSNTFFLSGSAGGGKTKGGHMTKSLPPRPNLDYLKREARRILRNLKAGQHDHIPLLQATPKYADASADEIAEAVALLDVQHALACDYGFAGWKGLKTYIESKAPALRAFRPVLKVGSFEQALEHYRDWLGFRLDWEWREAPRQPTIAAFSRDDAAFMVTEYQDGPGPVELHLDVSNLDALVDEWNMRRPGAATVHVAPPGEFPEVRISDAWGNLIAFEGKEEATLRKRREPVRPKMRQYVESELNAGRPIPTPEQVREAVGPPIAMAVEVLNEFPEYAAVYQERLAQARKGAS
jgi:catechol 2,3-dioxygenase-like lactoylglutathione lyase family enzyme